MKLARLIKVNNKFRVYIEYISSPEYRSKSGHKNSKEIVWNCVTVQIFGDDCNKSKFDSGGN
jgi:hypothetical protein